MYLSCALLCYLKCNALCSTKQDWSRLYCFRDALQCPLSTWFFPRPGLFLAAFIKFLKRGAFYVRRKVASLRASPRDWTWYTGYKLCRQRSKPGSWYNILQLWNERKEECRSISISNLYLIGLFPTEIVQNYCFLLAFTYLGPSPKVRLNAENNTWCKIASEHLGQFCEIHCRSRKIKVPYKFSLMSEIICTLHCVISFQTNFPNSVAV